MEYIWEESKYEITKKQNKKQCVCLENYIYTIIICVSVVLMACRTCHTIGGSLGVSVSLRDGWHSSN